MKYRFTLFLQKLVTRSGFEVFGRGCTGWLPGSPARIFEAGRGPAVEEFKFFAYNNL